MDKRFKKPEAENRWDISPICNGKIYYPGSVEDGPEINIIVDEQGRNGYVPMVGLYCRSVCKEAFRETKNEVIEYMESKGFELIHDSISGTKYLEKSK